MGDVQLVTSTRISKTTLTLGRPSPSNSALPTEPPAFTLPPRSARIALGGTAKLDGKVRGYPEPQITWYKNGKPVTAGDRNGIEQSARGTFSLVIKDVQEDDGGKYTCEAVNDGGTRQVTVELTVEAGNARQKYNLPSTSKSSGGRFGVPSVDSRPSIWGESPPKFVTKPSRLILKHGQSGKFSAKITGRPQPQVIWLKGDAELKQSDNFNLFEKSGIHFLEIRDAQLEDSGMYTCSVVNSAGKASSSAELTVQSSATKSGIISAEPSATVIKTEETSESQHTTANGIIKQQKSTTTAVKTEPKETLTTMRAISRESNVLTQRKAEPVKKGSAAEPKTSLVDPKAEVRRSEVQQKTSSTITLQSVKVNQKTMVDVQLAPDPRVEATKQVKQQVTVESRVTFQAIQGVTKEPGKLRETSKITAEQKWETKGSPPRFEIQPQSLDALEGQEVTFKSKVSGSPQPDVKWIRDGIPLRGKAGLKIYEEGGMYCLSLAKVQKDDYGQYTCTAINSRGQASCTWTLKVKSPIVEGKAPFVTSPLKGCAVSEGQDFVLQCSVEAKPSPQITWLLDDNTIQYAHATFENGVAKLTVQDALPEDGGLYTCVAENSCGRATCSAKVVIKEKKAVKRDELKNVEEANKTFPPVFLKALTDMRVMDGSQVRMTVEVTGNPQPEIVWLHNGKEIQESEDFHFEKKGNEYILYIQEVFPEDTGKYTCAVWNEFGETRSEATLTVQEPQDGVQPWFISKPKSVTAGLGQHTLLSCAIAGDPFPDFQWLKDGKEIVLEEACEILQNEDLVTLLFRNVQPHHAGEYEIKLKNPVGDCSCLVSLFVREGSLSSEETHQTDPVKKADPFGEEGEEEVIHGTLRLGRTGAARKSPRDLKDTGYEADVRGLLKRRVETKEHCEDKIRQQEAEQVDFRTVLGKKVTTKSISEEDLKELSAEQMDFRANLQRQVKPKTLSEDDRKVHNSQQVDFRAVLGKKSIPKVLNPEKSQAKNAAPDFRSVLGSKKKPPVENNNNNNNNNDNSAGKKEVQKSQTDNKEQKNDVNCEHGCPVVDGSIIGKKSNNIGKEPVFTEQLGDTHVTDGERLRLQCQVASDPPPVVTWSLDGKVIKSSKFIVLAQEGGVCSLIIDKALPEDEGKYKCIAENSAGRAECCCFVHVDDPSDTNPSKPSDKKAKKPKSTPSTPMTEKEATIKRKPAPKTPPKLAVPPQILQFPDDMKVRAGEPVELFCKFGGTQPITCTWLKFKKQIEEKGPVKIENTETTSKLTISPAKPEHCGFYILQLENKHGSRQAQINITIVDKPEPPAGVPCTSDIRSSTLTLSWYGPTYDGGSAVQSYTLEIWNSMDKQWTDLATCCSTSYNIQDLLPDREYKFRLRAANVYGVSEPSQESDLVKLGEKPAETKGEEAELSDDDADKDTEPEYRNVTINTNQKVNELYNIEERLGTGKFGQVFKLSDKKTGKIWAGKFIRAYSAKDKEHVRQEIRIMNDLHHPKLVQCIDAFESKADIVMVMEIISGGELFERIIDEDFELTEREVIKYMKQITDGVQFIHQQGIVHLDLKPENIMCVNKTGTRIKLIDFGLARRLENSSSVKVLFGTPEFVAPEVINYEAIGYVTDMWSIGVICYILVSGLSPFMGDNDNETLSNVTSATWDFDDDAFDEISDEAKNFISSLLKKDMKQRMTCSQCIQHPWLQKDTKNMEAKKLSKERMKKYILRRKWQKTGHAVRAIGRLSSMAMISGLSGKKGGSPMNSPSSNKLVTEDDVSNQFLEALDEERTNAKPYFSRVIKDVEVVEGSAARFDCKIEGFPDPEVVWYKDEQPIKETRHFQIDYDEEGNCCLVISDVSGEDDAKYTCKAVNSLGEATCTAELIVEVMGKEEEEEEEEE
ncbi:myosin light chain kinase, smooth muscle-like isoform X1 [Polyodon spathula]|uniref:myosin light chain kinase, smooth muscle-like isoform X1 n=1 Tax=Polyodon spathula TaxID=7913 RepID=UPI001B7E7AFB|nr:myosin light chain kinase, smooth muscle-like isoform X1 [Polyodon spathula]XP_041118019.1 myosin light chain kinase, smooth muscle-like isoform X1 [Polyodon spathula]